MEMKTNVKFFDTKFVTTIISIFWPLRLTFNMDSFSWQNSLALNQVQSFAFNQFWPKNCKATVTVHLIV